MGTSTQRGMAPSRAPNTWAELGCGKRDGGLRHERPYRRRSRAAHGIASSHLKDDRVATNPGKRRTHLLDDRGHEAADGKPDARAQELRQPIGLSIQIAEQPLNGFLGEFARSGTA